MLTAVLLAVLVVVSEPSYAQSEIWNCDAERFYADPGADPASDAPLVRREITSPAIILSVIRGSDNALFANFELQSDAPSRIFGAPVKTTEMTPAVLGKTTFERAVNYMAVMSGQDSVRLATSYTTYQVLRKNGDVYVLGLSFYNGPQFLGKAILWPGSEIIGVCQH